jgi:hypothetical protein
MEVSETKFFLWADDGADKLHKPFFFFSVCEMLGRLCTSGMYCEIDVIFMFLILQCWSSEWLHCHWGLQQEHTWELRRCRHKTLRSWSPPVADIHLQIHTYEYLIHNCFTELSIMSYRSKISPQHCKNLDILGLMSYIIQSIRFLAPVTAMM